jgi:beta-carotene hydroxylase
MEHPMRRSERDIAELFIGKTPWIMVWWGIGGTLVWLTLWPLVLMGIMPLWAGAIAAMIIVTYAYLPAHEALHNNIAMRHSRLYWLNELVAEVALIPLGFPRRPARMTHIEHHRHTNDPQGDPDYVTRAPNMRAAIWQSLRERHSRTSLRLLAYRQLLIGKGTPDAKRALIDLLVARLVMLVAMIGLAIAGFAIEAVLLWWLPRQIAITYIDVVLSWAPHHPAIETGRYRSTRAFVSPFGTILTGGLQYHIIHHLYPAIPLHKTPAAYRAMRPLLEKRGCDLGHL